MTTATTTRPRPSEVTPPAARRHRRRVSALLAAGAAAALTWIVMVPVASAELRAPGGPGAANPEIGLVQVVLTAVVATSLGWALLALIERTASRPRTIWTTIALVFTVVSLAGPLTGVGLGASQRVLLAVFHVVVATVAIPLLRRTAADDPRGGAS